MATITDIAQELNISTATVSRALNQSRLVTPDLAEKINETAKRLGYVKRTIRRHRGRAILNIKLVLAAHQDPERALYFDLSALIEGLQSGFQLCGINLLTESNSKKFQPYPHKKGGDINGFIFAFNRPTPATLKEMREHQTPFIILNRDLPGLPCVASQNAIGMEKLVEHLLPRRPAMKPAFISLGDLGQVGEERLQGFSDACKKKDIPFDKEADTYSFDRVAAITREAVAELAEKYDTMICGNDIVGTAVLAELCRLGISVPSQVAVTGFDNSPVRNLSRPLLTTISMPVGDLAKAAASILEKQIIEHVAPKETLRLPGTLIVGEST